MSPELLEILKGMDWKEVNTQMALQCAPVLMDIKISNMLIIDLNDKERIMDTFFGAALSFHILYMSDQKVIYLIYDWDKLTDYLYKQENQRLLQSLGYHEYDPIRILTELSIRYQSHMQQNSPFPHELGLLLGYPLEDVLGFMINRGRNPLYTGYWKVYDHLEEKLLLFEQYRKAKERVIRLVAQGISIKQLISFDKNYGENIVKGHGRGDRTEQTGLRG